MNPSAAKWHALALGLVLLAGLALRLHQVDAPPWDRESWRETQTLMLARNYHRGGMNLFRPEVDWRPTDRPAANGVVGGTELNVVPWLTAALYHVFGTGWRVGRVVPVIFSVLGLWLFYRMALRLESPVTALAATLFLATAPTFIYYGRVQMPESFMFAAAFATLLLFDRWAERPGPGRFAAAWAVCALMLLAKPHMVVMAVPMGFLALRRFGARAFLMPGMHALALCAALPAALWMLYSQRVLLPINGLSFSQPELINWALALEAGWYARLAGSLWSFAAGPALCLAGLAGMAVPSRAPRPGFAWALLLGAVLFFFLLPGGNSANPYYQMIAVPPLCLFAGRLAAWGFARPLTAPAAAVMAAVVAVAGIFGAMPLFEPNARDAHACGVWIRENTAPGDLVLTSSAAPTTLYFADRIGWICWRQHYGEEIPFNADTVNAVGALGAKVLAISDPNFNNGHAGVYTTNESGETTFRGQYHPLRDDLYDSFACSIAPWFTVFDMTRPAELDMPGSGYIPFGVDWTRKHLRGFWGVNLMGGDGQGLVPLGPAHEASVRFRPRPETERLVVRFAAAAYDQTTGVQINGHPYPPVHMRDIWVPETHIFESLPPTDTGGMFTVTFHVSHMSPDHAGILLYWIADHADPLVRIATEEDMPVAPGIHLQSGYRRW